MLSEACVRGCHFGTPEAGIHVGPASDYFCNFILNSEDFPFSSKSGAPAEVGTNTAAADELILETHGTVTAGPTAHETGNRT